jgi:hypothetical protein
MESGYGYRFHQRPHWPPLAWVAHGRLREPTIDVEHGVSLERSEGWFGELVWDGDFEEAGFDQSDLVYGSGARRRDRGVTFVASSHTMDRLVWCLDGDRYWISNSLPALLAQSQTRIDAQYAGYPSDFTTMIMGLSHYRRELAGASRKVQLLYHDNLRLEGGRLTVVPKPVVTRDLSTYAQYRDFLIASLVKCGSNLRDPGRRVGLQLLGTLSTGFDSPTVCALARSAGLSEAITITSARGGADDSGRELGRRLGIRVEEVSRDAWKSRTLPEVPFLSADAKGEDVYYCGAESVLSGKVLLTGYAAGAWARRERPLTELSRADQSGLSLTEYRLWVGFMNLAVPTMGLRSGGNIHHVCLSAEMQQWSNQLAYNKPFCRRVLLEAGVSDSLFGAEKKAASVLMFDRRSFLCPASLFDFREYLQGLRRDCRRGVLSHQSAVWLRRAAARTALAAAGMLPGSYARRAQRSVRWNETAYRATTYDYLFGWATGHAIERYRSDVMLPRSLSRTS